MVSAVFAQTDTGIDVQAIEPQGVVESGQIEPDSAAMLAVKAPQLSPGEMNALLIKKLELRKRIASQTDSNPPGPPGLPLLLGRETLISDPADMEVVNP